jgi:hypothetical protein
MDTKKYTIVVDGVKEAIDSVKSLKETLDSVSTTVEATTKVEKESAAAKKTSTSATDELGKVQKKLNEYDAQYQAEVAKAKAALKGKNDEVKNALTMEQDLQTIENASMNTYKEKQSYLSALNRVIRNMTDEETVNGKTKQELIQISAEVQQSLKDEDEQMKIYTRNVGNYKSAVEGLEKPHKGLKQELKEIKGQMAQMLVDGISPIDEAFQALAERAGMIKDAIGDAGAEVSHFASDTAAMDNVVNVATTLTASYGLVISSMQAFGIENDEVIKGIQKLEAVQTALNSLNSLSSSLLDNSTASYKIYHAILQAVGLEKKTVATATTALNAAQTAESAGAAAATTSTTALTAAEGAEAVGATTAASATAAFAASLWAVLSPLLVIVATVALVVAGIYGLVEAYDAIFGPTEEETKAMEAQCQAMDALNSKTAESIDLLKQKSDEEAEWVNAAINAYQQNIVALEQHVEQCKEFYGEDSDEYKKALEEKEKAEQEYEKYQKDGLEYLTKIAHQAREKDKEETMGKFNYQRKKAEESYNYQVTLMKNLVKLGKITAAQEKQMLADLQLAYKQAKAQIDKDEKESNTKTTTRSTNITRGTGGSSKKETDAQKAAKEWKKASEELSKTIQSMSEKTTQMLVKQQERALEEAKNIAKEIKVNDKKSYDEKITQLRVAETEEINVLAAKHALEIKGYEAKWAEIQTKYKGHTDLLKKYQDEYETQVTLSNKEYKAELEKIDKDYFKQEEDALKEYKQKVAKENNDKAKKALENLKNTIDSELKEITNANDKTLSELQGKYQEYLPEISDTIKDADKVWKRFWELPPDADNWHDQFVKMEKDFGNFPNFIESETAKVDEIYSQCTDQLGKTTSEFEQHIINSYKLGLEQIITLGEQLKREGKTDEEVTDAQVEAYQKLGNQFADYKKQLIDAGKAVGDFKTELNALGEVVEKVPSDGLSKGEKAAKKWGTSIKKVIKKYVEPFQDAFNKMGDAINSVFDAMNDWIQVDIDKLADALEEIEEKYDDLTDAVETTEDAISDLKEEFKSATGSDKEQIAKKIAAEENMLAQEKAAQQEAYNTQVELDEQKQELENEQQKRELTQQQFSAGISLISSLISTAEGMSKEYSKGILGIPTAVLIGVLGGIQAAAITAQIAALQAQKSRYAEGGYVDGDGMLQGPSHADGGIDIKVGKKGRVIEAEGGEFIINRKSSAKYYDLLTRINDYGKTGKTISGFNQTKFANGGSLNFERVNDSLSDKQTEKQMQRAMENVTLTPKVSVVDIIKKTKDYNRVRAYAGR